MNASRAARPNERISRQAHPNFDVSLHEESSHKWYRELLSCPLFVAMEFVCYCPRQDRRQLKLFSSGSVSLQRPARTQRRENAKTIIWASVQKHILLRSVDVYIRNEPDRLFVYTLILTQLHYFAIINSFLLNSAQPSLDSMPHLIPSGNGSGKR